MMTSVEASYEELNEPYISLIINKLNASNNANYSFRRISVTTQNLVQWTDGSDNFKLNKL